MALDWTTFALEIVNFLALLWILKRFLYRPILKTLAERQSRIERSLNEAHETEKQALSLKNQFESRLADWAEEKAAARASFEAELLTERARQSEALIRDLAMERERSAAQEAHQQETLTRERMAVAGQQAVQFASKLLARLAGPELEMRLVQLFIEALETLPDEALTPWHVGQHGRTQGVSSGVGVVRSAYPLSEDQRRQIFKVIEARLGLHDPLEFVEDDKLLAGVRLLLGDGQLDFSLAGELEVLGKLGFFAEGSPLA